MCLVFAILGELAPLSLCDIRLRVNTVFLCPLTVGRLSSSTEVGFGHRLYPPGQSWPPAVVSGTFTSSATTGVDQTL